MGHHSAMLVVKRYGASGPTERAASVHRDAAEAPQRKAVLLGDGMPIRQLSSPRRHLFRRSAMLRLP